MCHGKYFGKMDDCPICKVKHSCKTKQRKYECEEKQSVETK